MPVWICLQSDGRRTQCLLPSTGSCICTDDLLVKTANVSWRMNTVCALEPRPVQGLAAGPRVMRKRQHQKYATAGTMIATVRSTTESAVNRAQKRMSGEAAMASVYVLVREAWNVVRPNLPKKRATALMTTATEKRMKLTLSAAASFTRTKTKMGLEPL